MKTSTAESTAEYGRVHRKKFAKKNNKADLNICDPVDIDYECKNEVNLDKFELVITSESCIHSDNVNYIE